MPNLLISDIDSRDPFQPSLVSGQQHAGPVLTLLGTEEFSSLLLLLEPQQEADALLRSAASLWPGLLIQTRRLQDGTQADPKREYAQLQSLLVETRARHPETEIYVSISSGPSARHVAWLELGRRHDWLNIVRVEPPLLGRSTKPHLEYIQRSKTIEGALREESPPLLDDVLHALDMVGENPAYTRLLDLAADLARQSHPVLIYGEPGTGKTTLARLVARLSARSGDGLVTFDPSDMPDLLAATTLFGHTASAFRGATAAAPGRIAVAGRGYLLIENVERLHRPLQEQLVRYIDTQTYLPFGATEEKTGHARLILTCSDTSQAGAQTLLPALAERLKLGRLHVPALHERRSDIPLIVLHYLRRINSSLKAPRSISRQALEALQYLSWPNNINDLRMAVERSALFADGPELTLRDIRTEGTLPSVPESGNPPLPELSDDFSLEGYMSDIRRRLILRALELAKGNQSEAARLLHITPQAVHQFLKLHTKRQR